MKRFEQIKGKTDEIIEYILSLPDTKPLDENDLSLRLAIEEAVVNKVNYAYPEGDGYLDVDVKVIDNTLTVELRDNGTQFDPLSKSAPDLTLSAAERPIGGLGIFLIRKIMDDVRYRYENQENILTLVKNI